MGIAGLAQGLAQLGHQVSLRPLGRRTGFHTLDRWVYNAGVVLRPPRDTDLVLGVDLDGFLWACHRALPFVASLKGIIADELRNERGRVRTLLTLQESIQLNRELGAKHTPELKVGNPDRIRAVFGSQEKYAQAMIDAFKAEGVSSKDVWPQSFDKADVLYWIRNEPRFGRQAVYLDDIDPTANPPLPRLSLEELRQLKAQGVKIIAPPIFALLAVENGEIGPSQYAKDIRGLGFDIITWSFERSDLRLGAASAGFYWMFDPTNEVVKKDSDMFEALDVLAKKVGVLGVF